MTTETADPHAPKIPTPEELDLAAKIDSQALLRWTDLPEGADVVLRVSRQQMDALFLGLRNLTFAQGDGFTALQAMSAGDVELANKHFARALERHHHALAQITFWTSAVMARAEPDE